MRVARDGKFDKVINRPLENKSKHNIKSPERKTNTPTKAGSKGNPLDVLSVEEGAEHRTPFTFMEIFENALENSNMKILRHGKEKMGGNQERGSSPTLHCYL